MRNTFITFSVFLLILLTGCSKPLDPILGFKIGSPEKIWQDHARTLMDKGIIEPKYEDTYIFNHSLIIDKDTFNSVLMLNSDDYWDKIGYLVIIDLSIKEGSRYSDLTEIKKVMDHWITLYGEPTYSDFDFSERYSNPDNPFANAPGRSVHPLEEYLYCSWNKRNYFSWL